MSWYGGLNKAAYEGYCTGVSAMLVTRSPCTHSTSICGPSSAASRTRRADFASFS